MTHTCVKDGRTGEHELQFWMCGYPAHERNPVQLTLQYNILHSQFMYCMLHYLHTHWAVLPRNVFNTLKRRNNTRKGEH